jgi:hypothetical protein
LRIVGQATNNNEGAFLKLLPILALLGVLTTFIFSTVAAENPAFEHKIFNC